MSITPTAASRACEPGGHRGQPPMIRAGVLGLGLAGREIVARLTRCPQATVTAVADVRADALAALGEAVPQPRLHREVEQLAGDPDVDAVWVATPTHLHATHAEALVRAGKHVIVDKPMAASLAECARMIDAAHRYGRVLLAGGARSFHPAFRAMAAMLDSGRLGPLRSLTTWAFTSWQVRPREPYELDADLGGGMVLNQGTHVLDVLRYLGGGKIRTIRAAVGADWLPQRGQPGYFTGLAEFESGAPATFSCNGYGFLDGADFVRWADDAYLDRTREQAARYRRLLLDGGAHSQRADRDVIRYGHPQVPGSGKRPRWLPTDAGLVIASCAQGELRQSPSGVYVIDDSGQHETAADGADERSAEVTELLAAMGGGQAVHDGEWGMATLEAALAVLSSAHERREITLRHQVTRRSVSPDH